MNDDTLDHGNGINHSAITNGVAPTNAPSDAPELSAVDPDDIAVPRIPDRPDLEVDSTYIRNVGDGEGAAAAVEKHHRDLFGSQYSRTMAPLREVISMCERAATDLDARLANARFATHSTFPFVSRQVPGNGGIPWTTAARIGWFFSVMIPIGLLVVGVNTLATYLRGSGYELFAKQPVLAYLVSTLSIGLAVLLDTIPKWLRTDRARQHYFFALCLLAIVAGVVWIVTFSAIFPDIRVTTVGEIVSKLTSNAQEVGKIWESIFVGAQLIGEICAAAALWMHAERVAATHRPDVRVDDNPAYVRLLGAERALEEKLQSARQKKAEAVGALEELKNRQQALINRASAEWAALVAQLRGKSFEPS
jgi:hypothetical protein